MSLEASSIGDLAASTLSKGGAGVVTRVFQRSAYVRSGDDFILLLWGGLRSPMTMNLEGGSDAGRLTRFGERCGLSPRGITFESGEVGVGRATIYRSPLLGRRKVRFPAADELAKGAAMLRALYDVSLSGPTLVEDSALESFARMTLRPLASGKDDAMFSTANYLPLIGRGGGFTPAGDDFVCGLVTMFNYVARCRRTKRVSLPRKLLLSRTVAESAAILSYSSSGYADEALGRLVINSLTGKRYYDELLAVAHRGHTSGIDMSLGALLGEAALAENRGTKGALDGCLDVLWRP